LHHDRKTYDLRARNSGVVEATPGYGRVSRIREHTGPSSDVMGNTFEEFRRDEDGRIIWRRVGFAG